MPRQVSQKHYVCHAYSQFGKGKSGYSGDWKGRCALLQFMLRGVCTAVGRLPAGGKQAKSRRKAGSGSAESAAGQVQVETAGDGSDQGS
jgi:hypothetical protein